MTTLEWLRSAESALEFARDHKFDAETIRELELRVEYLRRKLAGFPEKQGD